MQSLPAAMTWEILRRGRWNFIFTTLGTIAFPALLIFALRGGRLKVDINDPSLILLQILLMESLMFVLGAALYGAQGKISALYAYPARTTELVAWRLIPAMILIAAQLSICIVVLNLMFDVQWPLWGPALFSSVSVAAVMSVGWLTEKSIGWTIVALSIVGSGLGMWFRTRFGNAFSDPTHTWSQLTPVEMLIMLAIAAASYWVAVLGVSRNRRGEPPLSVGLSDWIGRTFERFPSNRAQLATPFQAQCWLQWHRKGWSMPTAVCVLIVLGLITWLVSSRNADDLFEMFFVGGHMLWGVGFIGGLHFGNAGPSDTNFSIGHFFATRPMTDSDMARAILRSAIKSILLTWSIWLVAFAIVCICLVASGASDSIKLPNGLRWWYFPATLLGPWVVAGAFMSLMLVGSEGRLLRMACIAPIALFIIALGGKFLLSTDAQAFLDLGLLGLTTTGLVAISCGAYMTAYSRSLIRRKTAWAAAIVWLSVTVALSTRWPEAATPHWLGYSIIAAAAALTVFPIASVPLALSWNRHR